ncbi:MAG TPA: hypothetical protein VGN18_12985 [Jatrophihabitans sp.]|jgi:hypothetical protein|uniref:hypothetical protein n=1 Tax=Jatrophihabitans sp. TaxID=1932789 RepID=UPI002DFCFD1E|nr:hypothetical protein [Jatrophihabitans sp.]
MRGPSSGADDDEPVAVDFDWDGAGVEDEDADEDADEDLDAGGRRRIPGWFGQTLLAAAAVLVLIVANLPHPHRTPQTIRPPVHPLVIDPSPVAGSSVEALLVSRHLERIYTVIEDRLAVSDLDGGDGGRFAISSTALGGPVDSARLRLVLNPADGVLWVVPLGSTGSHLIEGFDPRMLRRVARLPLPYPVDGAAVLDGRLYLTYGPELLRVSRDRKRLDLAARLAGSGGPLVADPVRHRLLYLDYYNPLSVRSWSPARGLGPAAPLPMTRGQVAVVAGTIWVGGFGTSGAVLARLDPRTLRAGRPVELAGTLAPGTLLAAAGGRSLFVRAGGAVRPLWCLDARTGAVTQHWDDEPGVVAADLGAADLGAAATAAPDGRIRPLALAGCAG